jgi:glycosyltransferase involved in cell wall biosynthesis
VVTNVLDAIQWAEPGYKLPLHYDLLAKRDIRVASHIITISHAAKIDLNKLLKVPLDKISVTQLAAIDIESSGKASASVNRFLKGGKFFLFVGGTEKRKNLRKVIEAYAQSGFNERLAVVGPTDPSPVHDSKDELLALLTPAQQKKIVFLGRVSGVELNKLYSKAVALVFPTRYEGFGLPALEAMKAKTPVITSNVSSLPEVVDDAALTVDPIDPDALASAMQRITTDAKLRAKLVKRSTKNLKRFSWKRTAQETVAVYEKIVRNG